MEEFNEGIVMESLKILCNELWQIPNFEASFDIVWKMYKRFSFFHKDFLRVLKSQLLESLDQDHSELVEFQSSQKIVADAESMVPCIYVQKDVFEETSGLKQDSKVEAQSEEANYDVSCEETSYFSCKDGDDELLFLNVCKHMHDVDAKMSTNPDMCVENGSVFVDGGWFYGKQRH